MAALVMFAAGARQGHTACNVTPGTELAFTTDLGSANRPFAAPGDGVEVRVGGCDVHSPDVVACGDRLLQPTGSCVLGAPHPTFASFTGLPSPNDYKSLCTDPLCTAGHEADPDCCLGDAPEMRFTVDAAGNILVPMNWQRILPHASRWGFSPATGCAT